MVKCWREEEAKEDCCLPWRRLPGPPAATQMTTCTWRTTRTCWVGRRGHTSRDSADPTPAGTWRKK